MFIGILIFHLVSVAGIVEYVKRKRTAIKLASKVQNKTKKVVESPTSSLPDRLINPSEYESLPYIPQGHAIAEEVECDAEKNLNHVYTYGSISKLVWLIYASNVSKAVFKEMCNILFSFMSFM